MSTGDPMPDTGKQFTTNDIVTIDRVSRDIQTQELQAETARVLDMVRSKRVPKSAVRSHPGKGGKVFEYLDHVWVTKQLIALFPVIPWSWDVVSAVVEADGSSTALGRFSMNILWNESPTTFTVTEVGMFEGNEKMSHAAKKASAASRSLVKCVFRRFGWGAELYKSDNPGEPTVAETKASIERLYKSKNLKESAVKEMLKSMGFTTWELIHDNFGVAYSAVYQMSRKETNDQAGTGSKE